MTLNALSRLNPSLKMTMLSLLTVGLLSGCGIRGQLKTPPPLFTGSQKVDPQRVPTDNLDAGGQNRDEFDAQFDDILDNDTLADF